MAETSSPPYRILLAHFKFPQYLAMEEYGDLLAAITDALGE